MSKLAKEFLKSIHSLFVRVILWPRVRVCPYHPRARDETTAMRINAALCETEIVFNVMGSESVYGPRDEANVLRFDYGPC